MASRTAWRWLRRLIVRLIAGIACGVFACSVCTSAAAQIHTRLEPRAVVEKRLQSFRTDNGEREAMIQKWFAESGCVKTGLSVQPAQFGLPPNVICVLRGESREIIVVGAHTDKVQGASNGVVDNWTGAALLPSLLFSLNGGKRHHTFVFVGFTGEEQGMIGSEYYARHLTAEQRAHIEAMVNMDSLGLAPTKVWASHSDRVLLDALASVATASKLPISTMNVDNLGTTDSESFATYHIPRITLHSVTPETMHVLHSPEDRLAAIKMDDYYDSYRLIAEYLAYLDDVIKPAGAGKGGDASH